MSWAALPPAVRQVAEEHCTEKELVALRLWENGAGYRRIGLILGISMSSARGRVHRAVDRINVVLSKEDYGQIAYPVRGPAGSRTSTSTRDRAA